MSGPEYTTKSIETVRKYHPVDYGVQFINTRFIAALFLAEVASSEVGFNLAHKDFEKLVVDMWLSALYYIGQLDGNIEAQKRIRIYRAYIGALQIQFVVLAPVIESDNPLKVTFSLFCPDHWRYHLRKDEERDNRECSDCCCKNTESTSSTVTPRSSPESSDDEIGEEETDSNSEYQPSEFSSENPVFFDLQSKTDLNGSYLETLLVLSRLSQDFCEYTQELYEALLASKTPKNLVIGDTMTKILPSERTNHSSTSPEKDSSVTPNAKQAYSTAGAQPKKGKKTAGSLAQNLEMYDVAIFGTVCRVSVCKMLRNKSHMSAYLCTDKDNSQMQSVIVKKETNLQKEAKILSKLVSSRFIVDKVTNNCLLMHQELLIPLWSLYDENDTHYLPVSCQFYLDGLNALMELKKANIVHCDISPNNFMFSEASHSWKLLDFEYAVEIDPGVGHYIYDKVVGTDEYIAPESVEHLCYSFASDLHSFTAVFYSEIGERLNYLMEVESDRRCKFVTELCNELLDASFLGDNPNPQDRASLEVMFQRGIDVLVSVTKQFKSDENYWGTIYGSEILKTLYEVKAAPVEPLPGLVIDA